MNLQDFNAPISLEKTICRGKKIFQLKEQKKFSFEVIFLVRALLLGCTRLQAKAVEKYRDDLPI
jgi:hypothetical protein